MRSLKRTWQSPGLIAVAAGDTAIKLILFMSAEARGRWEKQGDSLRSRHYRNQAFAPPRYLPRDTVSVFTDGSAVPRKLGQLFPPAGYGVVAVTGGRGHEHHGGSLVHEHCAPLGPSVPNLETSTNNSAELLGFTRALQWADRQHEAHGRPVCMRYDSVYAAMIASGTWRPKAHRALAREAQEAWSDLYATTGGQLWLRHVRGHRGHVWNTRADKLANDGRQGRRLFVMHPWPVD